MEDFPSRTIRKPCYLLSLLVATAGLNFVNLITVNGVGFGFHELQMLD